MAYANTKEVAATTGFQQRTVEDWCRTKKISARRTGELGQWRVEVDENGWPVAYDPAEPAGE